MGDVAQHQALCVKGKVCCCIHRKYFSRSAGAAGNGWQGQQLLSKVIRNTSDEGLFLSGLLWLGRIRNNHMLVISREDALLIFPAAATSTQGWWGKAGDWQVSWVTSPANTTVPSLS